MSAIESDVRCPGIPPLSNETKALIARMGVAAEACAQKLAHDYPAVVDANNDWLMFAIRTAFLEGVGFGVRVTP